MRMCAVKSSNVILNEEFLKNCEGFPTHFLNSTGIA